MKLIVITGAAGFIGSNLVEFVSRNNSECGIVLVDDFSDILKENNWNSKRFKIQVERKEFINWFNMNASRVSQVYHLGARTDTTEKNEKILDELNFKYSQAVWRQCTNSNIPLVYASSAATYGLGEFGYEDNDEIIPKLKPLNLYGESKNKFDLWVLDQKKTPTHWFGVKFFNVYGPNEYHKNRMASVVFHAYHTILREKKMRLFKSHRPDFQNGHQKRDFIYVKDVVSVCHFLMNNRPKIGIYNVGTGNARTFLDLALLTFRALDLEPTIEFVDTPEDIRDKYQYFTQANMTKLRNAGYSKEFYSLEKGIEEYVNQYLILKKGV